MKTTIKEMYHDALFYASSPFNQSNDFYITPSEFKVLIKLIHYSKTYDDITFQSKDIAKHTFLAEQTIKNSISSLLVKGYITSELNKFNNRLGWATKRTININWNKIQEVLDLISTESIQEPVEVSIPEVVESTVEPKEMAPETNEVNQELIDIVDSYYDAKSITEEQRDTLFHLISTKQFSTKTILISEIDYYKKENLTVTN